MQISMTDFLALVNFMHSQMNLASNGKPDKGTMVFLHTSLQNMIYHQRWDKTLRDQANARINECFPAARELHQV